MRLKFKVRRAREWAKKPGAAGMVGVTKMVAVVVVATICGIVTMSDIVTTSGIVTMSGVSRRKVSHTRRLTCSKERREACSINSRAHRESKSVFIVVRVQ